MVYTLGYILIRIAVVTLRHPFGVLKRIQNLRLRRCFFCVHHLRSSELGSIMDTKKPRKYVVLNSFGGERGIRTPGPVTVNSFQDYRNRPLCHLSAANVGREKQFCKKMANLFMNSMVLIT